MKQKKARTPKPLPPEVQEAVDLITHKGCSPRWNNDKLLSLLSRVQTYDGDARNFIRKLDNLAMPMGVDLPLESRRLEVHIRYHLEQIATLLFCGWLSVYDAALRRNGVTLNRRELRRLELISQECTFDRHLGYTPITDWLFEMLEKPKPKPRPKPRALAGRRTGEREA